MSSSTDRQAGLGFCPCRSQNMTPAHVNIDEIKTPKQAHKTQHK